MVLALWEFEFLRCFAADLIVLPSVVTDGAVNESVKRYVEEQGLVFLGVSSLNVDRDYLRFEKWLEEGKNADMAYLQQHLNCRKNPQELLPGAKVAIIFGLPYQIDKSDNEFRAESWGPPRAAQYARFEDYHKILRKKGEIIADNILQKQSSHVARVVVDSAPILERALASKSSNGFIGKNTCYIHQEFGSFLLLGEILTSVDLLEEKFEEKDGCGSCTSCETCCPTGALSNYSLDSQKCLAYWTIEHRGPIPEKFWPWLKIYYFGCDICQSVCPYNRLTTNNKLSEQITIRKFPSLFEVATMDQKKYENYFGGTPMTRAKRNGLRRNALIAMTVTKDSKLNEAIQLAKVDAGYPIAETLNQIEEYRSA